MSARRPPRILFVTGLSGAGKSTALRTLEDLGWEVVDNLPLPLLDRLLAVPLSVDAADGDRPLAVGIDARTRGFDADAILNRAARLRGDDAREVETLFLDCSGAELARRFSETRRRHPLAQDRPVADGILRERTLLEPLRRAADHIVDTTATSTNALQQELRRRFEDRTNAAPTLTVMSFGFSRGVPREADLLFDMRFLRNPHWDPALRPLTGFDAGVSAYVAADPAYAEAMERIEGLIGLLLPRYAGEGKSYVTIAIGCTGGRHRSVHVAERLANVLRAGGFSPTVLHRDLAPQTPDSSSGRVA
ncbi:RNase adapter RapZ [Sphingomonas solaris]|uniref:RNase adapter RapZ n=1 Tax=Alterirhizorhabdus solaris TaxID=2529389 RepID=A0A558QZQ3_9SPHN|nr:RNase adapter RapZ [Sphingomonas solaris]TVV72552.1 RNase adapter RapZ [Sphingomonas solaris]